MFQKFNRFDPANPIRFYAPADDGGSGGSGGNNADPNVGGGNENPKPNGGNANDNPANRAAEIATAVQQALAGLLGKNGGDKDATLEQLVKKNHGLEKQRDDAIGNALSKEDRAAFQAFKGLNLSATDLKKIVDEHGSMSDERAKTTKTESLKKAAAAAGLNADLLASLDGALGVEYQVSGEGKSAVATVKFKDGDKEVVKPLRDWTKEKWPHLEGTLNAIAQKPADVLTRYGKSAPLGGGNAPSLAEQIRKEEEDKKKRGGTGANGERQTLAERLGRAR